MGYEFEILEARIKRLESQNRRLKWLGIGLVVLAMASAAWGQTTAKEVTQAQKFELRDDAGHLRAELAMLSGGPALRFFDADGDVEALLGSRWFTIFSKSGENLATFRNDGLQFDDAKGNTLVSIDAYQKDQMGKIFLKDVRSGTYLTLTPKDLEKLVKAQ